MLTNARRPLFFLLLLSLLFSATTRADELASTTQPASEPSSPLAEKWQYTLFHPVPHDQLRGMDTDRPNVTNTPHTIDAGHLQIETGLMDYTYARNSAAGDTVRTGNAALADSNFRLGVLNNLELNAVINPYQINRLQDEGAGTTAYTSGFGDTVFGAKLNLWGNEGGDGVWQSGLAIQPQFKFPTARNDLGNGRFEFAVQVPFLVNLPAGFHLGLESGASLDRNNNNDGYVAGTANSISIDRVVVAALDVYVEYASDVTTQKHVEAVQTIDVGATYPLNDNIVLDGGAAIGLNRATNNFELLTGISFRF